MLRACLLSTVLALAPASTSVFAIDAATVFAKQTATHADFPGGPEALHTYLTSAVYPEAARASQAEGRVFVHFEISSTGKVENPKALLPTGAEHYASSASPGTPALTTNPALVRAAENLIANMPAWQPATKNGNPIMSTQTVPIDFQLLPPTTTQAMIYAYADQLPVFTGNTPKSPFPASVYKSVRYPAEALRSNIQGKVMLYFVVNEQGQIEQADIIQSAHPILDEEALRVVRAQTASTPALYKSKPVKMFFTMPITFAYR